MNDVLKVYLSLSLSGSIIILVLLVCKRFWKDSISRQWQYYVWLIVIARLLFPFAPETNLMGSIFRVADRTILQADTIPEGRQAQGVLHNAENIPASSMRQDGRGEGGDPARPSARQAIQEGVALLSNHIWQIWLVTALVLLVRKITVYQSFVRYVKAGQTFVSDVALLDRFSALVGRAGMHRPVELCVNPLISSPLFIGFFNPCIVLPSTEISERDLRYTVLHELTHYRRRDMLYKWLVQITACLHWFNPLVYVMGREINKACEFSCDEAIITRMDGKGAQEYGETLLETMMKAGNYKESLASVTLNENKKILKERLGAIMSFKKKSIAVKGVTAGLTLALCMSAAITGAYAAGTEKADVWVVDGEEADHLPADLEKELSKDPIVRDLLDLGDAEASPGTSPDKGDDIWGGEGGDTDDLTESLEKELKKDPIVREQLGLWDTEGNANAPSEKDDDRRLADGNETDEQTEKLKEGLAKDPVVKGQLGLDGTEEPSGSPSAPKDDRNRSSKERGEGNTSNPATHIAEVDGTNINNVIISGENLGIVIEKSSTNHFEFDYVGVSDTGLFSFHNTINPDGALAITVSADPSVKYTNINPDNKINVVNIKIPEKDYHRFTLNIQRGGAYLPDIAGDVHVDSEKSLINVAANPSETNVKFNLKKSSLKFV